MKTKEDILAKHAGVYKEMLYVDPDAKGVSFIEAIRAIAEYHSQFIPNDEQCEELIEELSEVMFEVYNLEPIPPFEKYRKGLYDVVRKWHEWFLKQS